MFKLRIVAMPFTLAHPAAVLPLKRFCPRPLSFAGLVVGSIVPDAGYLFGHFKVDEFSHTFMGSFGFDLPAGILMVALFYGLRRRAVEFLPETQRRRFLPLCSQPVPSIFVLVISILLGAWTHLLWDSFTHKNGWFVQRVPLLQLQMFEVRHHPILPSHIILYASSFAGVAWLCYVYEQLVQMADSAAQPAKFSTNLRNALFVGVLVLPIEAVHHLAAAPIGLAIAGLCSAALVLGILLWPNPLPAR